MLKDLGWGCLFDLAMDELKKKKAWGEDERKKGNEKESLNILE